MEIYSLVDGETFAKECSIPKEKVASLSGSEVKRIEGQQLLKDPATGLYHLYLVMDVGGGWETFLFKSKDPRAPWSFRAVALARGERFDSVEARDCSIGIIDGFHFALYKARCGNVVRTALATSGNGVEWRRRGVLSLDGKEQPDYYLLCGSFFAGSLGPIFVGFDSREFETVRPSPTPSGTMLLTGEDATSRRSSEKDGRPRRSMKRSLSRSTAMWT